MRGIKTSGADRREATLFLPNRPTPRESGHIRHERRPVPDPACPPPAGCCLPTLALAKAGAQGGPSSPLRGERGLRRFPPQTHATEPSPALTDRPGPSVNPSTVHSSRLLPASAVRHSAGQWRGFATSVSEW